MLSRSSPRQSVKVVLLLLLAAAPLIVSFSSALPALLPPALQCGVAERHGCEEWIASHHWGDDMLYDFAITPDGSKLFATILSKVNDSRNVTILVAMRPEGGDILWQTSFFEEGYSTAVYATAIAPDSSRIYSVVNRVDWSGFSQILVRAHDGSNGTVLWTTMLSHYSFGVTATLSPDGSHLYVGGSGDEGTFDALTVAFDTSTGALAWQATYDGRGRSGPRDLGWAGDRIHAVAVSPDGTRVFASGGSASPVSGQTDAITFAYEAATGQQLWMRRTGAEAVFADKWSIAVSPDGEKVFALGADGLLALKARDGTSLWEPWPQRSCEPWRTVLDRGMCIVRVHPTEPRLFAWVGRELSAYDVDDGLLLWSVPTYVGPQADGTETDMEMSPDGKVLYVLTEGGKDRASDMAYPSSAYVTEAYDSAKGTILWRVEYNRSMDNPGGLAVGPANDRLYVAGDSSQPRGSDLDPQPVNLDAVVLSYSIRIGLATLDE